MLKVDNIRSSYKQNNYGYLFYSLIRIYKPVKCVELGGLEGYSALYIAKGLKDNGQGKLDIIDLFEDYPYNKSSLENTRKNFIDNNLRDIAVFKKGDVFEKINDYREKEIDFLHIDLSNDGGLLEKVFKKIYNKLSEKCLIIFEGGSEERDNIEWMKKYKKKPIRNFLRSKYFQDKFDYFVFAPFPALTICSKKE